MPVQPIFLAQKLKGAKSKRNRYAVVSPGSAETLLCPPALWQDVTTEGSLARAVPARGTSWRRKGWGDHGGQRTEPGEAAGAEETGPAHLGPWSRVWGRRKPRKRGLLKAG